MRKFPIPRLPIQGLIVRCLTASGISLAAGCPVSGLAGLPAVSDPPQVMPTVGATRENPAKPGQSFNISNSY